MENKVCFIGHREILVNDMESRIKQAVINEIKNGATCFMVGSHGMFDKLALKVCKNLKTIYKNINIDLVITSLSKLQNKNDNKENFSDFNKDVNFVMFDIEQEYFKRQISISNRKMIDCCSTLICYVDTRRSRSGAKSVLNYAIKKGLKIINLFCTQDDPTYNMTKQEKYECFKTFIEKTDKILKK